MVENRVADWGNLPVNSVRREHRLRSVDVSGGSVWKGDAPALADDAASTPRSGDDEFFEVLSEIRLP